MAQAGVRLCSSGHGVRGRRPPRDADSDAEVLLNLPCAALSPPLRRPAPPRVTHADLHSLMDGLLAARSGPGGGAGVAAWWEAELGRVMAAARAWEQAVASGAVVSGAGRVADDAPAPDAPASTATSLGPVPAPTEAGGGADAATACDGAGGPGAVRALPPTALLLPWLRRHRAAVLAVVRHLLAGGADDRVPAGGPARCRVAAGEGAVNPGAFVTALRAECARLWLQTHGRSDAAAPAATARGSVSVVGGAAPDGTAATPSLSPPPAPPPPPLPWPRGLKWVLTEFAAEVAPVHSVTAPGLVVGLIWTGGPGGAPPSVDDPSSGAPG
jgi:hypothetical protein